MVVVIHYTILNSFQVFRVKEGIIEKTGVEISILLDLMPLHYNFTLNLALNQELQVI